MKYTREQLLSLMGKVVTVKYTRPRPGGQGQIEHSITSSLTDVGETYLFLRRKGKGLSTGGHTSIALEDITDVSWIESVTKVLGN